MNKYGPLCACKQFTKLIRLVASRRSNKCAQTRRQTNLLVHRFDTSCRAIETPAVKTSQNQANWPIWIFAIVFSFAYAIMMNWYRMTISCKWSTYQLMIRHKTQWYMLNERLTTNTLHKQCQSQLFGWFIAKYFEGAEKSASKGERESNM